MRNPKEPGSAGTIAKASVAIVSIAVASVIALASVIAFASVALAPVVRASPSEPAAADGFPATLAETGLYSDFTVRAVAPDRLSFSPRYPLWTDGAAKHRWLLLPPGTAIDASDPDRWVFPVGTRIWKEFVFGRSVETRLLELRPDGWHYAAYVWNEEGTEAVLAPAAGVKGVVEIAPGIRHDIPGRADCRVCHDAGRTQVLGLNAIQLSPEPDPLAPNAARDPGSVDLAGLRERGLLTGWPESAPDVPRILARTARERAVLGYLHGNCASCHRAGGPLDMLGLDFEQRVVSGPGTEGPASAVSSVSAEILRRLSSRDPYVQMPPLGTHRTDEAAIALVESWIREELLPVEIATNHPDASTGGKE